MAIRVGINGFGRMGRLVLRAAWGCSELEFTQVVDALSSVVIDGTQVKVYAWYDNEWGYVNRMLDIATMVARGL